MIETADEYSNEHADCPIAHTLIDEVFHILRRTGGRHASAKSECGAFLVVEYLDQLEHGQVVVHIVVLEEGNQFVVVLLVRQWLIRSLVGGDGSGVGKD